MEGIEDSKKLINKNNWIAESSFIQDFGSQNSRAYVACPKFMTTLLVRLCSIVEDK